jgi:rare lipoprotein A (peptidoglycan hydrolase)
VALAAGISFIAAPLVLLGGGSVVSAQGSTSHGPESPGSKSATSTTSLHDIALANNTIAAPTTTTTVAPTTTTTAPPAVAAAPVEPLYAAPTTTTTIAPPAPSNSVSGIATWYNWNPGQCASPTLPHGTVVQVTNEANGETTSCTVTDTEAAGGVHVIDLDTSVFEAIAGPQGLSAGTLEVTVTW